MEALKALKAEMQRKRKELEENDLINSNKKYFRRGDLSAIEAEEYLKKTGNVTANQSIQPDKTSQEATSTESSEQSMLPRNEVIRRLRDREEPILLFGESEIEAFKRLRQCEILEPEINRGFRNDFQEAMDRVDREYLDEILESARAGSETSSKNSTRNAPLVTIQDDPGIQYEEIQELAKNMGQGDKDLEMKVIMMFLQLLLKIWGDKLNNRTREEKVSTKGKLAGATFTQTQVYLNPLLRKLKSRTIPDDILDSLTEIIRCLLSKNYLQASDAYLQMAIGNAPWPIGVTMVGIHARTGREKIFSKNVAHVMNDETQRKYIQALKRLMTKCQEYFPTDPSRCVEYVPPTSKAT